MGAITIGPWLRWVISASSFRVSLWAGVSVFGAAGRRLHRVSLTGVGQQVASLICLPWYQAHLRPGVSGLMDSSLSYPGIFEVETAGE